MSWFEDEIFCEIHKIYDKGNIELHNKTLTDKYLETLKLISQVKIRVSLVKTGFFVNNIILILFFKNLLLCIRIKISGIELKFFIIFQVCFYSYY